MTRIRTRPALVRVLAALAWLTLAATVCLLAAQPARGAETLDTAWRSALSSLEAMPVQSDGYIRSAHSFAQSQLDAITGRSAWDGMRPLESLLWLVANPETAHSEPLIRVSHPDLAPLLGGRRTSLHHYREPAVREQLLAALRQDEMLLKPINELEGKAALLEQLEGELAFLPREGEWLSPVAAADRSDLTAQEREALESWESLKQAIAANQVEQGAHLSERLASGVRALAEVQGAELPRLGVDLFYHTHQPFKKSSVFYLFGALGFGASLFFGRRWAFWAGMTLMLGGFLEQSLGVGLRWVLAGRAPLSNMYESFTFATAGMILIGLVLEWIYRTRLAGLGGTILGFIFMVVAHNAPIFDPQIRPLMPALQSSWLTYHVVTIMLSYSAFALSFFVALVYLGKETLGGDASGRTLVAKLPSLQSLDQFNYRIIAVGFPLLTLGIVTGAIWAATAWGRPWAFDPKEAWSAITWLVYAIFLHVRYLAGWRGRRTAFLSLVGFAAVLFTYLGVNYLLPGLHSYAA